MSTIVPTHHAKPHGRLAPVGAESRPRGAAVGPSWPGASPVGRLGRVAGALAALALALFLLLPLVAMAGRAVVERGEWDAATWETLRQAMRLSLVTTAVSLLLTLLAGTPLAWAIGRRTFRGASAADALIDLPIVLPPAVAGIALLMAFGRYGLLGQYLNLFGVTIGFTTAAVVLAQLFVSAPFYVRAATAAFARIHREVEESAADLGAPPGTVLRTITLPMALPGLLAGATLAWARALGEFGATIMFAGNFPGVTQTMPLAIYGAFGAGNLATALLLSTILLLVSGLVLVAVRWIAQHDW